jgi:hypothetical protein
MENPGSDLINGSADTYSEHMRVSNIFANEPSE